MRFLPPWRNFLALARCSLMCDIRGTAGAFMPILATHIAAQAEHPARVAF